MNTTAVERRHVTIVFCDLVGSTALANSMDPEDYTEVLRSVLRRLTEVVEGFGGFVAQYLGDGTLNYFGYPSANEDDTARAVTAALAMVAAVSNVTVAGDRRLEARVGIAAGEVIIGDIVGTGGSRGLDMAGELPSLAARLQAEAQPGTVIVDGAVCRIVEHGFVCRNLGERKFKGWDAEITIWQVVRPIGTRGRNAAQHRSHLAPLVGRVREASQLAEAWRTACAGAGSTVLLVGDAGIGKSRLLTDLLQTTAGAEHTRIVCGFSALQQGVPLAACLPAIERLAGFQPEDGIAGKREKLAKTLSALPEAEFELIAGLLGVPSRPNASQGSPRKQRERTIAALRSAAVLASRKQPLLIAFEDIHWSDPTSAELLHDLVRHVFTCPILLILTARPGVDYTWLDQPGVTAIRLDPLDMLESQELIGWIRGAEALPSETVRGITHRCDGIPLYLEEITKAAVEANLAKPAGLLETLGDPMRRKPDALPGTIHSSLLARLDRLGSARDLAEIAAAVGRDFSLELLAGIVGESKETLWPALSRLIEAGLVVPCPPNGRQFRFKHVLLQNAAYGMITRRQRVPLHARIVDAFEAGFPDLAAAEPQLLAYHCTEAELPDRASVWWLRAGIQSLMRSATVEALAQLSRGLDTVEMLPLTTERDQAALNLRIAYAKALIATQGYAAAATGKAFAMARAQCDRLGHPPQFLTALHGQWSHALFRGDIRDAKRQADWILEAAETRQEPSWRLVGCYALGITSLPLGDFPQACIMIRRGLAEFAAQGGKAYAGPILPDPVIIMQTYLSWALMCMGRMDEARQESAAALARADQLGLAFSAAFALWHDAYLTSMTVSIESGLPRLQSLHRLAAEHGNSFYEAMTTFYEGWSHAMLGRHDDGFRMMREGRQAHLAAQTRLYAPSNMRLEAEALGLAGRIGEGLRLLDEADLLRKELGADWDLPELMRTRGQLLWAAGQVESAEIAFQDAIALASRHSAKQFSLNAALAYAERLAAAGRSGEAALQLAPVCTALEGLGSFSALDAAHQLLATVQRRLIAV